LILERVRRALLGEAARVFNHSGLEDECDAQVNAGLEMLEKAIHLLPKPPGWILRLPVLLKKPAIQIFNLIYLHRDLGRITDLRQACVRSLEKKYAALMGVKVEQKHIVLCKGWAAATEKQIRAVKRLQSNLDAMRSKLKNELADAISSSSLFRLSALNEILLTWAHYAGRRPQTGFRQALLTERKFFKDWHKKNRKTLQNQLVEFCREVYQPLSEMDLDEVLAHRNGKNADDLAMTLSQGSIPLLRPNFDQTGSGPSHQMRFFLSRDPRQSSVLSKIKGETQDWQEISTGDSYLAICCRIRAMIPSSALTHILQRGKDAFDTLDDETKQQYVIVEFE
jgi:hypothetical protein